MRLATLAFALALIPLINNEFGAHLLYKTNIYVNSCVKCDPCLLNDGGIDALYYKNAAKYCPTAGSNIECAGVIFVWSIKAIPDS